jgi:sulfate/thiosulfate transport system ATP-binding protein
LPVAIEQGRVVLDGQVLNVNKQGLSDGKATLCIRPYDIAIQTDSFDGGIRGKVTRVYGLGPARRAEIVLASEDAGRVIEINTPNNVSIGLGQVVNLSPLAYRLFPQQPV